MFRITKLAAFGLAASLVFLVAPSVRAAHESLETLAHRLHTQSRGLAVEIRDSFRFSPDYRHLASDAAAMVRSAEHLHEIAHDGANLSHLRRDLREFESSMNHIHGVLHHADVHTGQFGHSGHIALGRVGVNMRFAPDTRRVYAMLHQIEDTAERLEHEIERLASRPRPRDDHNLNGYAYPLGGGRPGGPAFSFSNGGGLVIRLGR